LLTGFVRNNNGGVEIVTEGLKKSIEMFLRDLSLIAPSKSRIENISSNELNISGYNNFRIIESNNHSDDITSVSPDIAVCEDCLADRDKQPHRYGYPLINCTNCGPRFTIIKDIPYDRIHTTMGEFEMCDICKAEFKDVEDRRYHAQPVACNNCGPKYKFLYGNRTFTDYEDILDYSVSLLGNGEIIAVKGMGGFHLVCDALNEQVVRKLRERKKREQKPFAVMFPDMQAISDYAHLNVFEIQLLESWRRPIVILNQKGKLAFSVSNGLGTVGAILPYMPFHYDLFRLFQKPVVLTSGNINEEPVCVQTSIAKEKLKGAASTFITHDRHICNRADDSVATVVNGRKRLIRRARGYCPEPVYSYLNLDGIFAAGAELSNTFAIGKNNAGIMSQYIGDLKNYDTYLFYKEAYAKLKTLFRFEPKLAVCDLHPDYLSTQFARTLNIPVTAVQHHHAHIASCMAENGLDEKVIGVAFDGTGYGTDGNSWGSEFMIADLCGYKRVNHFEYFKLPGGDTAVKEPWRIAISLLYKYYGEGFLNMELPFLGEIPKMKIETVMQVIQKDINSPLSSGAGRLFDAVAALTGLCLNPSYNSQGPILLENSLDTSVNDSYATGFSNPVDLKEIIDGVVSDTKNMIPVSVISGRFHNTMVDVIYHNIEQISKQSGINRVVLSGGVFQNKYLLTNLENKLNRDNYEVYSQSTVPSNDGGIALGQLVIASKKREYRNS
jgi:hydrogenase maturation protein HypF